MSNHIKLCDIRDFVVSSKPTVNITEDDTYDMIETCGLIIHDYVHMDPLKFATPSFHDDLKNECFELLTQQLTNIHIENMDDVLSRIVERAHTIYFAKILPLRSFPYTFIRKLPNIEATKKKIETLRNIVQPEQRTTEWYNFRYNLITASNAYKALESQSSQNSLIYEKCSPLNVEKYDHVNTETPFHWGQKYEPISILIYENRYHTKIEDFGCIQDPNHTFLGASPDGINVDDTSDVYGRMLEVKNIVNREITGIPKREYWCQTQIQMGVCNLNECDFLETRFIEYESEEEFNNDGTFQMTADNKQKGIFMYFLHNGKIIYEYPQMNISREEFNKWEEEMMTKHENKMWVKNIYWKLDQLSCVLILRNKLWFQEAVQKFEEIWKTIEYERIHGYEHRAPTKREKKEKPSVVVALENSECLLNTNRILHIQSPKRNERTQSFDNTPIIITKIRSLSLDETKLNN